MTRVVIVSLGRAGALGERRRVASWRLLFEAVGAEVSEIRVTPGRSVHLDGIGAVVRGDATPERLAWSGRLLRERLSILEPAVVIVVTGRALDPHAVAGPWTVLLDLVDCLSRSYRDRADIAGNRLVASGYRSLAATHARFERRLQGGAFALIAAGHADARTLNAEWVPNLIDPAVRNRSGAAPDRDVLFFGTLRYPPNVDALERLGRVWGMVQYARPGTTAIIAGADPTRRVRELCARHEWELIADFSSLPEIAARARIAIVPLTRTAGIQNKVLDAAGLGLAQVVTPAALEGFAPGFPIVPCPDDGALAAETIRLLACPEEAAALGANSAAHVQRHYSAAAWEPWALDVVSRMSVRRLSARRRAAHHV